MLSYQTTDGYAICPVSRNTRREDLACAGIQGFSLMLVLGGVATLVALAGVHGTAMQIVSLSIYGATLTILYAFSFAYHASARLKRKMWYRVVDHSNIYLMIAGTYTPFTLHTLEGGWGWSLFGVIWGLAVVGITIKVLFRDRYARLSLALYLCMGWLIVLGVVPLTERLATGGVVWLVAAGIAYTVGVPFYLWNRLPYNHAVWHLFVLAGSSSFYFVHLFYVLFGI